jgi:hypothetical protein
MEPKAIYIGDNTFFKPWGRYMGFYWRKLDGSVVRMSNKRAKSQFKFSAARPHDMRVISTHDLRRHASNKIILEIGTDLQCQLKSQGTLYKYELGIFHRVHDYLVDSIPEDCMSFARKFSAPDRLNVLFALNWCGDKFTSFAEGNGLLAADLAGLCHTKRELSSLIARYNSGDEAWSSPLFSCEYAQWISGWPARAKPYLNWFMYQREGRDLWTEWIGEPEKTVRYAKIMSTVQNAYYSMRDLPERQINTVRYLIANTQYRSKHDMYTLWNTASNKDCPVDPLTMSYDEFKCIEDVSRAMGFDMWKPLAKNKNVPIAKNKSIPKNYSALPIAA